MGHVEMQTMMIRGAAVALLAFAMGAPIGAQAVAGSIRVRGEPRDSTEMRARLVTKARLDSIATMMRELNAIPPGTPEFEAMSKRIDALLPMGPNRVMFRTTGSGGMAFPKGWIGINAQGPSFMDITRDGYFVRYFDYPVVISVDPESPAKRAGIVPGDVLLAYDGIDVKGRQFDLTQLLVPDRKLSVGVRHDGEAKEYTVTVAPAPVQVEHRLETGKTDIRVERVSPPGEPLRGTIYALPRGVGGGGSTMSGTLIPGRTIFFNPNGAFGAILSTVGPELARTLKLEPGVLVNDVTDETPASRSGLRTGDVIVSVAGQPVTSLRLLQELVAVRSAAERSVVLQVMRDKRPQTVTVSW
jgi:serine protease Do